MTLNMLLRMKMKQAQFNELVEVVGENLSVLPNTIPIKDIALVEDQIQNKKYMIQYDPSSHGGSYELYEHFIIGYKKNKCIKHVQHVQQCYTISTKPT